MIRSWRCWLALAPVLLLGVVGCGTDTAPTAETVTVTTEKTTSTSSSPIARSASRPSSRPAATFVACDQNIRAKAGTTTCPFALNTFWAYWNSGRSTAITVYSPKAARSFETKCRSGVAQVICRTSDGGVVKFPQSAVDAYTQDMADAYAAKANLGPDGSSPPSQDTTPEPLPGDDTSSGSSGCSPEYSGCVPADAGDVDCTELSETDIDSYGSDPYGLDADGDGIACES